MKEIKNRGTQIHWDPTKYQRAYMEQLQTEQCHVVEWHESDDAISIKFLRAEPVGDEGKNN